jgi:hypothetical protein
MLDKVKSILKEKGYKVFSRPYELNIVGVRSKNTKSNRFDDEIHVFYRVSLLKWNYHVYKATTDPGTFWLENPMQPQGTAIMAQGQYIDAYEIGLHKGQYKALVQRKPITILRDYDRNAILDFSNGTKVRGIFGVNIHRAMLQGTTKYIDKFSAGCQVFQNANDFTEFMSLCEHHRKLYGNTFTYSLIDFRATRREGIKRMLIGAFTLGLGLWTYSRYNHE